MSIARALANHPPVILADEPTALLDSTRALAVVRILNQMAKQAQTAIIVVTHDEKIIPTFKRLYHIRDGQTVEEAGEGRPVSEFFSPNEHRGSYQTDSCPRNPLAAQRPFRLENQPALSCCSRSCSTW